MLHVMASIMVPVQLALSPRNIWATPEAMAPEICSDFWSDPSLLECTELTQVQFGYHKEVTHTLVELVEGRECTVCTPSHLTTGRIADFMSWARFQEIDQVSRYELALADCIHAAIFIDTLFSEGHPVTKIEAFANPEVHVPPNEITFRQHIIITGATRDPTTLEKAMARKLAKTFSQNSDPSNAKGFAVIQVAKAGQTLEYIFGYQYHHMEDITFVRDLDWPGLMAVRRTALDTLTASASVQQQDPKCDILIIEGAASSARHREVQRAVLRAKIEEAAARRGRR
jgi:hypothetical protein